MVERLSHSSHWGAFHATVDDGRVIGVVPHQSDPHPSPILASIPDAVHSDTRVENPAVRESWLANGPHASTGRRGAERFVEVTWDDALDLVAGELVRVRDSYGQESIFGGSYGWSSAGRFHHAKSQLTRFLNHLGGFTGQTHTYSYAAAEALLPHVLGTAEYVRGETTSWSRILSDCDLWVMFGGLPAKNTQVEAGGVLRHRFHDQIAKATGTQTQFINISPDRSDAPSDLRAEWIDIRPNTDTALMLALAFVLTRDSLNDRSFLDRYTVGFAHLDNYLRGEHDGTPKSPAWAEAITGVPADRIEELAHRMVAGRTFISCTWSLQRADHGEQPYWMVVALASMLGQIGLPGGGFGFGLGDAAAIGNPRIGFQIPTLDTGVNPCGSIPVARIADMLSQPGGSYEFDGSSLRYPDVRLVYWAGGNPFHHHQDLNRLSEAWQRPETIVVHEPWWTATARYADIVLPATTTLERNDIGASRREPALIAMKQAIDPVGSARNDHTIFAELAGRLGFGAEFTENRDERQWLEHLYEACRPNAARMGVELPDFAAFWQQEFLALPEPDPTIALADFRADPEHHRLDTPSGRIEIYSAVVDGFSYSDCPGHPVWLPPTEWLGSDHAVKYPLHLISSQPRTRLHSQMDMGVTSRESKIRDREPCRINTRDATDRGIETGDVILVYNDRGSMLAGAVLTEDLRRGVIHVSTGAWFDPADPQAERSLEKHGNPNVLTPDHGTSSLGQGPSAHSTLVEIERFAGTPPPVSAFSKPPIKHIDSEELR